MFHRKTKRKPKNEFDRRICRSITFTVGDLNSEEPLFVRDETKNTGQYQPNTLGEINGMNHPTVSIPEDADVAWFRKWVR